MTPTEQLQEEHQGITLMLKILEKVCTKMEAQEKVNPEHLESIVDFFRVFADKCHHGKEEALLFPEMEKAGMPREKGPIGVMLAEHTQGRAFVRGMGEAASRCKQGDARGRTEFAENARSYISLLTQHIQKENNILFPMGDRVLSKEKQEKLVEGFEELERVKIGPGMHETFHQLLQKLQEIYLK
jgi:hemerythrin-like domain-containing protein